MRLGRRRTPTLLLALTLLAARAHVASALPPVLGPETWTQVEPGFGPRYGHSLTYDPVGHRLILFGGSRFTSGLDRFLSDVWELDPVGLRMIAYGGNFGTFSSSGEVRILSLAGTPTWSVVTPPGTTGPWRRGLTATYDPVGQRMIVVGGGTGASSTQVAVALSLNG